MTDRPPDFPHRVALEAEKLESCRIRLAFCYGREAAVEIEATTRDRAEKSVRGFYETLPELEQEYQLAHPGWSSRPEPEWRDLGKKLLALKDDGGAYDSTSWRVAVAARRGDG